MIYTNSFITLMRFHGLTHVPPKTRSQIMPNQPPIFFQNHLLSWRSLPIKHHFSLPGQSRRTIHLHATWHAQNSRSLSLSKSASSAVSGSSFAMRPYPVVRTPGPIADGPVLLLRLCLSKIGLLPKKCLTARPSPGRQAAAFGAIIQSPIGDDKSLSTAMVRARALSNSF